MARGLPSRDSHAAALAAFYAPQADRYDAFRERLLHGRAAMVERLPVGAGARVIELGGGTGRNLDFFGERLAGFARVEIVDLCAPLLEVAAARTRRFDHVAVVHADASTYRPAEPADAVYFSYALTMIPAWATAVDNAVAMLRPGGTLGVVDFYVSGPAPPGGLVRHGWPTCAFWPAWFRHDGVHLSPEHLPYLRRRLDTVYLREARGPVPYLPLAAVPYYVFIGRKR